MISEIKKFLQDYDKAVIEVDIDKIASHFHSKFILSTPAELWNIANNDEFTSNLAKSFRKYKKLGAKICKMLETDIVAFKSCHYLANIKWGLIDDRDECIAEFDISYCIKKIDNVWKYILVIDHNEEERLHHGKN